MASSTNKKEARDKHYSDLPISSNESSDNEDPSRIVGVFQLVWFAYFTCAGGPFGIEICIQSGGPLLTLLGFVAMPILYEIPQALMAAELANVMPENGGYVVWVFRAFGELPGWINAYNAALCNLFDNAIYPTLIMEYYHILYPNSIRGFKMFVMKEVIVVLGIVVNIFDIRRIGNAAFFFSLCVFAPFTLGFCISLPNIDFNVWQWGPINSDGTVDDITWHNIYSNLALFFGTLFWIHTGWDGLGNFAGEVRNPQKTYPKAIAIALCVNTFSFLTSVVGGLTEPLDAKEIEKGALWDEGYFAIAYDRILPGLGLTVAIANTICQSAIYFSVIASTSRILATMGHNACGEKSAFRIRLLPRIFSYTLPNSNSPIVAVIAQSVIIAFFMTFDFGALVEASVTLNCITLVIEFSAFLYLRYSEPNTPRPFLIPGGMKVAWLITSVKMTLVVAVIIITMIQSALTFWVTIVFNGLLICCFIGKRLYQRYNSGDGSRVSLAHGLFIAEDDSSVDNNNVDIDDGMIDGNGVGISTSIASDSRRDGKTTALIGNDEIAVDPTIEKSGESVAVELIDVESQ